MRRLLVRERDEANGSFCAREPPCQFDSRSDAGGVVIGARGADHRVVMRANDDDLLVAANLALDVGAFDTADIKRCLDADGSDFSINAAAAE